jgi:hypothetical protein
MEKWEIFYQKFNLLLSANVINGRWSLFTLV